MIEFREKLSSSSDELQDLEATEIKPLKIHPVSGICTIGLMLLLFVILKWSMF